MDEVRITVAGDGFYAASLGYRRKAEKAELDESPHCCYRGWIFLGSMAHDPESGEEVEIIEAVRCRRCEREE